VPQFPDIDAVLCREKLTPKLTLWRIVTQHRKEMPVAQI
jgi:hypothetical protein